VGYNASASTIIDGLPTAWGNPLPWQKTALTPNLVGQNDGTDDIRPGMGWQGLANLREFVEKGGVLVTATDTSKFVQSVGMAEGVTSGNSDRMKIVGSILATRMVDGSSPIAYGYGDKVSAYCDNCPIFGLSSMVGGRYRRRLGNEMGERATGRGSKDEPDFVVGRPIAEAPEEPKQETWEMPVLTDEQKRNNYRMIPTAEQPRVILRFADNHDLLVSGLVEGGNEIAEHPAVIDVPNGAGHVVLFSINPVYRGETRGTYGLVLNTILNFDSLNAGRAAGDKTP